MELRNMEKVDKELEIIEKKRGQRDPVIRAGLLMSIYIIYLVYNYTFSFFGILNA